ncbi:peroxisomal membrane protein 2-like [Glandiceps talaboti]
MASSQQNPDDKGDQFVGKLIKTYLRHLRERPILTKAITSSVVSAIGDIIAQRIITGSNSGIGINWRSVAANSIFGFVITGPMIHHFYILLDKLIPKTTPYAGIKKVLFDRLVLAPPYLLLVFYIVNILDGKSHSEAVKKIKESFMTALIMNVKVWTVLQYININYVPMEYRVLFGNSVALGWNIYLAIKRR